MTRMMQIYHVQLKWGDPAFSNVKADEWRVDKEDYMFLAAGKMVFMSPRAHVLYIEHMGAANEELVSDSGQPAGLPDQPVAV